MAQRGISSQMVSDAISFGNKYHFSGTQIYFMGKSAYNKHREKLRNPNYKYNGLTIITKIYENKIVIVSVYKNKKSLTKLRRN